VDRSRIQKRLDTRYLDVFAETVEDGIDQALEAAKEGKALSIGVHCNAVELFAALKSRGIVPDMVTDQTSAHDPLAGYVPAGMTVEEACALRQQDPKSYEEKSLATMSTHVEAMLDCQQRGSHVFDYGNNIRQFAYDNGVKDAFNFPGFVPAYIRPLFCEGKGPFRWVALSGDPEDIYATDDVIRSLFPENKPLMRWLDMARDQVAFQGLPARICWLGYGERMKAGLAFNELVRSGKVKAPIVIGRDHLDCGSVASPNRETESMKDGSDAVADWPILNALINSVNGASWVSVHHGGGVGIGYSIHSGMVVVADGSEEADTRLKRVLTSDPGMGVIRHADAGYEEAASFAARHGVKIP
jgi:urocanate hydratase